ncbi:MAG: CAT RNA binding domain-containing protein, partial [Agathobacter sp.]|nr:CAT RNA binding domain-containing protein [Agathobacter sp.]
MVKIQKILNNNVVQILDDAGKEIIIMGRGIAFKKKVGDFVEEDKIDKRFYLADQKQYERFMQFLDVIPLEYIELAD